MPQADFFQWDRVILLKLICIVEMTMSSIFLLLYGYLAILQGWTSTPEARAHVQQYKWLIITATVIDFGLGSYLAHTANLLNNARKRRVLLWVILDSILLPVNVFLLRRLSHEIGGSGDLSTDVHLRRTILVHILYSTSHFLLIMGAINYLAYYSPRLKKYDPSTRPDSVFEPTDPQITTTESRHIRFSESFLQSSLRRSLDFEASTSNRHQLQVRNAFATSQILCRMNALPLVTYFWLKRFSPFLPRKRKKLNKDKMAEALLQIRALNPTVYAILAGLCEANKFSDVIKPEDFRPKSLLWN